MGIYRVKKNRDFVMINKSSLQDDRLSWKAKGIMAYMLSMPDDWTFYWEELCKHSTDGLAALKTGLKELKDFGYMVRFPVKDEQSGKITEWETVVYESPQVEKPLDGKPSNGKPQGGFTTSGKSTATNNDLTNNDLTKNNKSIKIKYAEFVSMTSDEYEKLINEFGESRTKVMIDVLDNYKGSKGKTYKSDYRAILSWVKDKVIKGGQAYQPSRGSGSDSRSQFEDFSL